jgi:hypothetical protein
VYPGLAAGGFGAASHPVRTWAHADLLTGVGDITADGHADVVARTIATGELRVYPGRGDGTFGRPRVVLPDASRIDLVAPAGDFDGDGNRDLLTRGVHGALVVRYGADDATNVTFTRSLRVARDWSGRDLITGGRDLTGDGRPDVVARSAKTHTTATYANVEGSHLSPAIGARALNGKLLALSPDVDHDGKPDLVGIDRTGELRTYSVARTNWLGKPLARSNTWRGTDKIVVVGDWDGDGYVDAMARRAADGTMSLYRGNSHGGFEAPVGRWPGWTNRRQITAVGDMNGDGAPDLMAQTRQGTVDLYPGRRLSGFKSPIRMRSSLPPGSAVVGVGLWTRDGAPDVLVRDRAGRILLYPGNGPGGLGDPRVIATGYRSYRTLVGVGDLTGDGQPDLVGRLANGQMWLIPGRAPSAKAAGGGFGPRQFLAADWGNYLLG